MVARFMPSSRLLAGVPVGTYQLEAVHPHLGTAKVEVTVAKDGAATAEFKLKAADYKP